MNNQQTTEARLAVMAGDDASAKDRITELVRRWLCPCLSNRTCRWPSCAKIGDGIGHYP